MNNELYLVSILDRQVATLLEAVNEKNPNKYVKGFDDQVKVFVDNQLRIEGKQAIKNNRDSHFKNFPNVYSEIQHLVQIDNKIIMHDKVWLNKSDNNSKDIVEIFTFENGKVIKIDVIQPADLFK